jgi:hypothetical protein
VIGRVKGVLLILKGDAGQPCRGTNPIEELLCIDAGGAGSLNEKASGEEKRYRERRQARIGGKRLLSMLF